MLFNFMCYEYYKAVRPNIRTVFVAFVCICFESMFIFRGAPAALRTAKQSPITEGKEQRAHIEIENHTTLFS